MTVLYEQVVQRERQVPVDLRPIRWIAGFDDDRAVQPHFLREVLANVRVVPVKPGVAELELVCKRSANWDRLLRFVRYTVVAVFQAESVPVDSGLDVAIVADAHC